MILENPKGIKPKIHPEAFVAETAVIIGDVEIKKGANIWYGAVLRGDTCKLIVGENTSIQDNCVVHSEAGTVFEIKDHCIVGHQAMLHGPGTVGSSTTIGIGAKILQGANVGNGCIIGAGAVVTKDIRDNVMALGIPARIKKELTEESGHSTKKNALFYMENAKNFKNQNLK